LNTPTYNLADYPPVFVAVPALDWIWTETARALIALRGALPPGSAMCIYSEVSTPAASRNILVERFLPLPQFEYILFLDSDMSPEPHTVGRLLSHNVDAVSAMCFMRHPPHMGAWYDEGHLIDYQRGGIQEVEAVGAACLMLKRQVIERLSYPWFGSDTPGLGEDILFCKKLRDVGYKIFLDTELEVGHMQLRSVGKAEAVQFISSDAGQTMIADMEAHPSRATQMMRVAYNAPTEV
jgi:hypothetical protein